MSTYIGSKISLISTSDVRYEGTLYSIDANESTIALENVTHMGTEDRRTDKVIEASSVVYQYIIFRGENIKNLKLIDEQIENVIINDPAVLEVKQGPEILKPTAVESPEQQQWNNEGSNFHTENWSRGRGRGNWSTSNSGTNNFQGGHPTRGGWNNGINAHGGRGVGYNQGNYNNNYGFPHDDWTFRPQGRGHNATRNVRRRGGRGGRSRQNDDRNSHNCIPGTGKFLEQNTRDNVDSELVIPDKEFDFQGNLARFDMSSMRDALNEETKKATEKEPTEPKNESTDEIVTKEVIPEEDLWEGNSKESIIQEIGEIYDAANFFDNLSTDKDVYNSQTGADMRELNAETFGRIGSTYRCRTRWFRRWRGRGRGVVFRGAYTQRK